MSIRASHVRRLLIRPTLKLMAFIDPRYYSLAAENLLMGTAAQESSLGYNMDQIGGPAMGIFQIEKETYLDIVDRYLKRPGTEDLLEMVQGFGYHGLTLDEHTQLYTNMVLGCAVARIKYWMVPEKLPEATDLEGLGAYWDKYYNANPEHGTVEEFVENYEKLVGND